MKKEERKEKKDRINTSSYKTPRFHLAFLFSFFIFIFSFACELFSGPEFDVLRQIGDEAEWAKAAKLNVRVEYPASWGSSNPTGTITPAKDIREGYAFEIEFKPDQAYSLDGWRAYRSPLPDGWTRDIGKLDDLERLDGVTVEVPNIPARGGTGRFTINTTDNITLVPWCKAEPYVIRTDPRNSPDTAYSRGTDIVIYFNAPLDLPPGEELDLFTSGAIRITGNGADITACYNKPVYKANYNLEAYTITVSPSDVPGDTLIEVTVGPYIYNAAKVPMAKQEVFSFSTASASSGGIDSYGASYDEDTQKITVNWKTSTTGIIDVAARYRVNGGGYTALAYNEKNDEYSAAISGVTGPDAAGVKQGRPVNGVREYEIFLDLYFIVKNANGDIIERIKSNAGSRSFRIWNIPGMTVNQSNTVILDSSLSPTEIRDRMNNGAYTNCILTSDITLDNWEPIWPTNRNFYGNGHTITINSIIDNDAARANKGLFGVISGGLVRDLTVIYDTAVPISPSSRFGGIAGYVTGSCKIVNCVNGGTTVINSSANISAGGFAGLLDTNALIDNCYSAIELTVNGSGSVNMGGITGDNKGTVQNVNSEASLITGTTAGGSPRDCGGITGLVSGGRIEKTEFTGSIDFVSGYNGGETRIGGIAGRIKSSSGGRFIDCGSRASNIKLNASSTSMIEIGGSVGYIEGNSGVQFTRCFSLSPIYVDNLRGRINAGGFLGRVGQSTGTINTITGCYAAGSVIVSADVGDGFVYAGGFAGYTMTNNIFSDCYALGSVIVDSRSNIYAGGFAGRVTNAETTFARCFSAGSVSARSPSFRTNGGDDVNGVYAGGFLGLQWAGSGGQPYSGCAVLGATVTKATGVTGNIGRLTNTNRAVNADIGAKNYCLDTTAIETGSYSDGYILPKTYLKDGDPDVGATKRHGANASAVTFKSPSFWRDTLGFGSYDQWNFIGVSGRGYPVFAWE